MSNPKNSKNALEIVSELKRNLNALIKARYPYVWLVSREDDRVLKILNEVAKETDREVYIWDENQFWQSIWQWIVTDQDIEINDRPDILNATKILEAFKDNVKDVAENEAPYILVFPDFHLYLRDPIEPNYMQLIRLIKWLYPKIRAGKASVFFLSNTKNIPPEIQDIIHVDDIRPPESAELEEILERILQETRVEITSEIKYQLISSALGLTLNQAERLFSLAITTQHNNPQQMIDVVVKGKKGIIAASGALEFFAPNEVPTYLAGLEVLKKWLDLRKDAFSPDARDFGLPRPKGVFLMGIPGTGKSLTAKYIAGKWKMPLLRFDMGAVFGSLVGQTEEAMRQALHIVEAIAPAILWVDEIEKAISFNTQDLDSGVSKRVFGSFLTWMQEKRADVFVIATANNVQGMPPELMRKGRFDEVFFLDLPTVDERDAIFRVHIQNVHRDPDEFDISSFVDKTQGFVGAEIEQIVKEALYLAFSDKKRKLQDKDFLTAINKTKPLSEVKSDMIKELREKVLNGEVVQASFPESAKKKPIKPAKLEIDK